MQVSIDLTLWNQELKARILTNNQQQIAFEFPHKPTESC